MSPELEAAVNIGAAAAHVGGALDGLRKVNSQTDPRSQVSIDIRMAMDRLEAEYDRLTAVFMKHRAPLKVSA